MSQKSKAGWGWFAFGCGLALCVIAGAVAGVLLGNPGDEDGDAGEARRVAALALDTRGLNDDALALSQAIEAAIEREDLEGEAAALRAELSGIEQRAARIQARAGSRPALTQAGAGATGAGNPGDRRAQRGLREVRTALGVLEHEVVDRLDSLLVLQPPSESDAIEELGQAAQVLEQQNEAMSALSSELSDAEAAAGTTTEPTGAVEDAYPVSGTFGGVVDGSGIFTVEYEFPELSAEAEEASEEPGVTLVAASASGSVEIENPAAPGGGSVPVPEVRMVLYWAEAEVPASVRQAELRLDPGSQVSAAETPDEIEAEMEPERQWGPPCRYELEGDRFCALAGLNFAVDRGGPLAPGENVELEAADEVSVALALYSEDTGPLVGLVESDPPDLIQVIDASPEGLLRSACTTPALAVSAQEEEDGALVGEATEATLGLLEADGAVVFEAAPTAAVGEVPCFEVRDE